MENERLFRCIFRKGRNSSISFGLKRRCCAIPLLHTGELAKSSPTEEGRERTVGDWDPVFRPVVERTLLCYCRSELLAVLLLHHSAAAAAAAAHCCAKSNDYLVRYCRQPMADSNIDDNNNDDDDIDSGCTAAADDYDDVGD